MVAIEESLRELDAQGYTLLKSCVDVKYAAQTATELIREYESSCPMPWVGGGKWFGHLNYVPSPSMPLIKETVSNARVKALIDAALGSDYKIAGFGGNANLPGSRYQPTHADGWLGTDFLVVNIPLETITDHNGSTEVWPGTHREKLTIAQFSSVPRKSIRINAEPGDVIMRHSNLWHRGTPNRSNKVRVMLAFIVSRVYDKVPPITVSSDEKLDIMNMNMPVNHTVGSNVKRGFAANYFSPSLKGNLLELTWIVAPAVFKAVERLRNASL